MFNYIRAEVDDRADPAVDDGTVDILQARFQIAFWGACLQIPASIQPSWKSSAKVTV